MYEPGIYNVRITNQGFDEASTQTRFFWMAFDPQDYIEVDGTVRPVHEVSERTIRMYITGATFDRVIGQLRSLGFTGSRFSELEPGGGFSFIGQDFELECQHETYKGKTREKWDVPYKRTEQKDGVARDLDALFGAELQKSATRQAPKQTPQSPPKTADPTTGEVPGDDVPF
jgi:hypothetical protein